VNHFSIDPFYARISFLHSIDPRFKLILVLLLIIFLVLSPAGSWLAFSVYFVIISALVLFARLPVLSVVKRSLAVLPFVFVIAVFLPFFKEGEPLATYQLGSWNIAISRAGVQLFLTIMIKAWLSILALVWLSATTRITNLLNALDRLYLPRILVTILSFMYRYIFVIADEMMRMKQARDCRSFTNRGLREIHSLGNLSGTLFIRSYERSERVFAAMMSRGYDGQNHAISRLQISSSDVSFMILTGLAVISAGVINLLLPGRWLI